MKKINIKQMTMIGIMTALLCVLSPFSIPVGVIPLSLTTVAILLSIYLLGTWKGMISLLLYLLIGLIGMPVFSGFSSGPAKLFGPTGGYFVGYFFLAAISGIFLDKFKGKKIPSLCGMLIGTAFLYLFGTAWLAYQAKMTFRAALWAGVIPFIPGDLIKITLVLFLGPIIKQRLQKASLSN